MYDIFNTLKSLEFYNVWFYELFDLFTAMEVEQTVVEIFQVLLKCTNAVTIERDIQNQTEKKLFNKDSPSSGTPPLFIAEKEMLKLSTYPTCTDGIFYAMPLIFNVKGEKVLYIRYYIVELIL